MKSEVFIIIPAYNESRVIRQTLGPLVESGYTVVVVDDASTDDTQAQIRDLPILRLRHPINRGQGAALQTGMTYSLKNGARYLVHFDADGQHSPQDIEVLLAPLREGRADVCLGSRFLRPSDRSRVPRARRMLLRGGVVFNGLLTGLWLSDAHNGFRAFTASAAAAIQIRENGFAHASEILQQIRQAGLRCTEQPTTIRYTDYSMNKGQSPLNAVKIVFDLLMRRILR